MRAALLVNARGSSREDDTGKGMLFEDFAFYETGVEFAVDVHFANAAGD